VLLYIYTGRPHLSAFSFVHRTGIYIYTKQQRWRKRKKFAAAAFLTCRGSVMCFLINNAAEALSSSSRSLAAEMNLVCKFHGSVHVCVFLFYPGPSLPEGSISFILNCVFFHQLRQENAICSAFSWQKCVLVPVYPHLTHQINLVGNEFEFFISRFAAGFCVKRPKLNYPSA
jgi:hypothetical protein